LIVLSIYEVNISEESESERERETCQSSLTDVTRREREKKNDCSHHILTSFVHQQKNFGFFSAS
jgi:hypothetical protein